MCGIAGLINIKGSLSAESLRGLVAEMTDQMIHRGPDDSGIWVSPGNLCAFGQRRLSIIDLSSAGHQPMASLDGKAVITFNGEIYNFLELRSELEARGVRFRTQTDTEVLIESLRTWGEDAFKKLDGMYAFALFDQASGEVIIGRDPFGEKPLYYTQTEDYFAFASELQCLTKLPNFDFAVDDAAMAELLMLQYIHAPRTVYRNARKLPPGHFMRISADGRVTLKRHFSFKPQTALYSNRSIADLADELQDILIRSIKRRMISDVPLGAFLSGGVDSSLVVALMAKECGREVQTFSIGFAGDKDSEHEVARATARHLGTAHHEKILAPDVMQLVEMIARVLDEPNADSSCLPVYLLSQFAREHVTVALSGDGGDELFGGYGRYFATLDEEAKQRSGDLALANWNPGETYFGSRICVFSLDQVRRVMRSVSPDAEALIQSFKDSLNHGDLPLMHRMREIDVRTYMPGAVLAKVDRMSMQHALEVRAPFLSIEIARFAEKLSPEQCYQNGSGKLVLKELLCRYLPREVVYRPKQGFGLPTGLWGKESLLPAVRKACDTQFAKSGYWLPRGRIKRFLSEQQLNFSTYQVWNILMLEMWLRAHRADCSDSQTSASQGSAFEQALLPFRSIIPLLETLSSSEKQVGVYVDSEPPPQYLHRFFSALHYVKAPPESTGPLSFRDLNQEISTLSASTILMGVGFDISDITTLVAMRKRGFNRLFYRYGDGWKGIVLTPWLHSRVPWCLRRALLGLNTRVTRVYHRVRRALARRVLNKFSADLFQLSIAVVPDGGFGWRALVPQFSQWGNDLGISQSDLLLFEGERLLEKDMAHSLIREEGGGRYAHWGDSIFFSTTDNTNPLENGQRYRIIHKPKKTKLLRRFFLAPERFFESLAGPSDSLARWYTDTLFKLGELKPFSLIREDNEVIEISSAQRLKIFKQDIAKSRAHGEKGIAQKGEGIVLFTSHLGPGGAERQLSYLAGALKRQGRRVSIITQNQPIGQLGHYVPMLEQSRIPFESLRAPISASDIEPLLQSEIIPDIKLLRLLPSDFMADAQSLYLALMRCRPQVLHCFLDSANIVGAVAGYLAGVPRIVLSARNVNPTHFEYLNLDWFLPWYRAVVSVPSVSLTANSVVGRDSYADWIGISKDSIEVIPNAIDIAEYIRSDEGAGLSSREELGLPADSLVALGVFRLSPEKRPLLFLRIMKEVKAKLPQLKVLLAGVGPMMDEVQTEIGRLGMKGYVHVLGRRGDIPSLIKASDLLCLLSDNEGSPNVVMEAQALGRPVVCTAVGGAPEIVKDGVTGFLVARDDEHAMVTRVLEILSSPALRQKMGEEATRWIESTFSIDTLVRRTLSAYGPEFIQSEAGSVRSLGQCERSTVVNAI
jgi:asparagine synthase (glutamine-hydrolysing)